MISKKQDIANYACNPHPKHLAAENSEIKNEDRDLHGADGEGQKDFQEEGEHNNALGHFREADVPGMIAKGVSSNSL